MDYKTLQETLSDYAKLKGKSFIWYDSPKMRALENASDTTKINTVWDWYKAFLPDEVYENFKISTYGTYHYNDNMSAQSDAEDWFPKSSLCPDADHYIYACVFTAEGNLAWENVE